MRESYVSALVEVGTNCSVTSNCGFFDTNTSQATWIATDAKEYKIYFDGVK